MAQKTKSGEPDRALSGNDAQGSALVRKLRAARVGQGALDRVETQALRLAVARAGRKGLDCDLMVTQVHRARVEAASGLAEPLASMAMTASLVTPEGDQGVVALDAGAIAAITALRTTGKLPQTPPGQGRGAASAIEAALTRPLVSAILMGWHTALLAVGPGHAAAARLVAGFRFANAVAAARSLLLALPSGAFVLHKVGLEFGGQVAGQMILVLPVERITPPEVGAEAVAHAKADARKLAAWQEAIRENVLDSAARLDAVLHRTHLPLSQLRGFAVGTLLPLPAECLDRVALEPKGQGPGLTGRLGQVRGARAVRLQAPARRAPGSEAFMAAGRNRALRDVPPGDLDADLDRAADSVGPGLGAHARLALTPETAPGGIF